MGCCAVGQLENPARERGRHENQTAQHFDSGGSLHGKCNGHPCHFAPRQRRFETGDSTAWILSGNANVVSDVAFRTNAGPVGSLLIGSYAVDLGGRDRPATGVLTQDLDTIPSHEYDLSFDTAASSSAGADLSRFASS
jgi:hypothetical protein